MYFVHGYIHNNYINFIVNQYNFIFQVLLEKTSNKDDNSRKRFFEQIIIDYWCREPLARNIQYIEELKNI